MPQDIGALVWIVGGGTIVILLGIIGYFLVNWISRHDTRTDEVSKLLAQHDKDIAVLKTDHSNVLSKLDGVLEKLDKYIEHEECFWKANEKEHSELLVAMAKNETAARKARAK